MRVLVVRGHEHDKWHVRGADRLDDIEAAGAGHLDVEKDEIRTELLDGRNRRYAVAAFMDDLEPVLGREQHAESLARERFIVDNQGADA